MGSKNNAHKFENSWNYYQKTKQKVTEVPFTEEEDTNSYILDLRRGPSKRQIEFALS